MSRLSKVIVRQTYIHVHKYVHTYRQTDRQTDRRPKLYITPLHGWSKVSYCPSQAVGLMHISVSTAFGQ